jgi:hypothetical protein
MRTFTSPRQTIREQLRRDKELLAQLHAVRDEREDHLHDAQMLVEEIIERIRSLNADIDNAYEALKAIDRMERLERKRAA